MHPHRQLAPPPPLQARTSPLLAAALGLSPQQLGVMACSLTVIVPAPAPPPGTPGEPPAVRRPYDVWKSALIGGFLGGIFLLELIVLAVSV